MLLKYFKVGNLASWFRNVALDIRVEVNGMYCEPRARVVLETDFWQSRYLLSLPPVRKRLWWPRERRAEAGTPGVAAVSSGYDSFSGGESVLCL